MKDRNKKLYTEEGYLNFDYILKMSEKHSTPFIFIVGGRATGKTYGALKYTLENNIKIMFMRRTQSQHDIIRKPELSPYTPINNDMDRHINFFPLTKYNSAIYESDKNDQGKLIPVGEQLGMTCALSTISNMRGFDASWIDLVVFDEFIPERHERPIKNEASALFNALETIGRNRELKRQKPLKLLALANANNISNEIFLSLGLVNQAEKMVNSGQELYFNDDKGIMLIILQDSPISEVKRYTSLYHMTDGTDFSDMALHNNFVGVCRDAVHSEDLRQYNIYLVVGELAIYKHKSQVQYYVTTHISGAPKKVYTTSINDLRSFRFNHRDLWMKYINNRIIFESYTLQVLFEKYNNM